MVSRTRIPAIQRICWVLPLLALLSGPAVAQWQWVDSTGSKVFSDTPPPAGIPDKNILKRPASRNGAVPAATPSPAEAAGTTTVAAPKVAARDDQLEARKKQAEDAEKAKKKAEDDRVAKARADNCERAKRSKVTMDSGIRIATTNAKGEREIMDDKARAQEKQRIDEIIRADCAAAAN